MCWRSVVKNIPLIGNMVNKPCVAVIRLSGVIADAGMRKSGLSLSKLRKSIDKAFHIHEVKAVCLAINSPGGSPAQSSLIGNYIRQLAEDKDIPVLAFVEDVAASGGYWLACAADEIYAQDSSIVGSIGVISAGFGFEEILGAHKINRRVHTSGKDKSFHDPFLPEQAKDIKRLKTLQKDIHEHFIDWVKQRRGDKLEGKDTELFEGAFWTAGQAKSLGLIDDTADLYAFAKSRYGDEVRFVHVEPDKGLVQGLLSSKTNVAEDFMDVLEARSNWGRFGL